MHRQVLSFVILLLLSLNINAQEIVCIDSTHYNPQAACLAIYQPVCGCDGSIPGNSCKAFFYHALSCWDGICPEAQAAGCRVDISSVWSGDTLFLSSTSISSPGDPIQAYTWESQYTPFANTASTSLVKSAGDTSFLVSLGINTQNGCFAYCTYSFDMSTSIQQPVGKMGVKTFPNPVSGMVQILFDQEEEGGLLLLMDMMGRMEDVQNWAGGRRAEMDVSGLAAGMYILVLQQGSQRQTLDRVVITAP